MPGWFSRAASTSHRKRARRSVFVRTAWGQTFTATYFCRVILFVSVYSYPGSADDAVQVYAAGSASARDVVTVPHGLIASGRLLK